MNPMKAARFWDNLILGLQYVLITLLTLIKGLWYGNFRLPQCVLLVTCAGHN